MDTKKIGVLTTAIDALTEQLSTEYIRQVQSLVDTHNVFLATGQMSDTWQVRTRYSKEWHSEFDRNQWDHDIFDDLDALDKSVESYGIGPSNMEMFKPNRKK